MSRHSTRAKGWPAPFGDGFAVASLGGQIDFGVLDVARRPDYHAATTALRIAVLVLVVIHTLFVGLTTLAGAFADGGDVWQRPLVVFLHPLGAAGVLLLVFVPRLIRTATLAIAALLLVNVIADLALAPRSAAGTVQGDWQLALVFAVVPAIGIVYALSLLRTRRAAAQ